MHNTRLDSCNCQEHSHARVFSALTYSVLLRPSVSYRNAGLYWGMVEGPI